MSVSIITFANFGKKHNLKTDAILPVIETFAREGVLNRIICLRNKGFFFKKTIQAIPVAIYYLLILPQKLFRTSFPSRERLEKLFDLFAQWQVGHADSYLFHNGYFTPRTFRRVHDRGALCIEIAGMAHPDTNERLFAQEFESLGISSKENPYNRAHAAYLHYNQFDYIIAQSEFVKKSYIEKGFPKEKIYVAHPDINIERFVPAQERSERPFRFLYMAYTAQLKGLHYLLEAWNALNLSNAELVLVGGYGDMPIELKRRYDASISRNSTIRWAGGSLAPEDHYHVSDTLVFPSLSEGFGKVTLEAMACGLPVITTENAKGIVEDGKTGFVVPIRDANALKEKIEYLYNHRDIAEQMGREARRAVEQKRPFGEAVYEIYQEILRREGRA